MLFSIADIDNGSTPSGEAGSADEEEEVESGLDTTEAGAAESQAESQSLPIRCAITISKVGTAGIICIALATYSIVNKIANRANLKAH